MVQSNEIVYEWEDGWRDEKMDGRVDVWAGEWMNDGFINGWTVEVMMNWIYEWMNWLVDE